MLIYIYKKQKIVYTSSNSQQETVNYFVVVTITFLFEFLFEFWN